MKHPFLLLGLAMAAMLSGCGGSSSGETSDTAADTDSSSVFRLPSSSTASQRLEIASDITTALRAYRFRLDDEEHYAYLRAQVQWPQRIGRADLRQFQDSLIAAAFPAQKGKPFAKALEGFLSDTSTFDMEDDQQYTAIPYSDIPADAMAWYVDITVSALEVVPAYATYIIKGEGYSGGAHGWAWTDGLTVDLASGRVITPDNLFKPDSREALLRVITDNLAEAHGVAPDHLADAGFDPAPLPMPSVLYIFQGNVVVHYGQYEIACYAQGMTDITLYPHQLADILSPLGRRLLGNS